MIKLEDIKVFEPFGESLSKSHPLCSSPLEEDGRWLIGHLSHDDNWDETEVYVKGRTAFLSVVDRRGNGCYKRCFTVGSRIKSVLWCRFEELHRSDTSTKPSPTICLCIMDEANISVFTRSGLSYCCHLPFKVLNVWPLQYGLCIERQVPYQESENESESGVPTLFSLTHPLDDFKPAVTRKPDFDKSTYFADIKQKVVFSCIETGLLLIYNEVAGLHTLLRVRKATSVDIPEPVYPEFSETMDLPSFSHGHKPVLPLKSILRHSLSPAMKLRPLASGSPFTKSLLVPPKRGSPGIGMHRTVSYSQSKANTSFKNLYHESPGTSDHNMWMQRTRRSFSPAVHREHLGSVASFSPETYEPEPLPPDCCLEQIWQEEEHISRLGMKELASGAFLMCDVLDSRYLCVLRKQTKTLSLLKLEHMQINGLSEVGDQFELPVLDAGPIRGLKMMVVLEVTGDISLYSGPIKVACLDVWTSLPLKKLPSESTPLQAEQMTCNETDMVSPIFNLSHIIKTGSHATPEVSSSKDNHFGFVKSLQDFTLTQFSIILSTGEVHRSTLPDLATDQLVCHCVGLIKGIVGVENAVSVFGSYFIALHSKENSEEWILFQNETLRLLGVPQSFIELLVKFHRYNENGVSPAPSQPKKAKTVTQDNSFACDAWCQLQTSSLSHPYSTGSYHSKCLCKEDASSSLKIVMDQTALLFPYAHKIFVSLHELFEEAKLFPRRACASKRLSVLLHAIASCLGLPLYMKHYKRSLHLKHFLWTPSGQSEDVDSSNDVDLNSETVEESPASIYHMLLDSLCDGEVSSCNVFANASLQSLLKLYSEIPSARLDIAMTEFHMSQLDLSSFSIKASYPDDLTIKDIVKRKGPVFELYNSLDFGLKLPIKEALRFYKASMYDAGKLAQAGVHPSKAEKVMKTSTNDDDDDIDDGMDFEEEILQFRFSCDLRIKEVKSLLQSSRPVPIELVQDSTASDHQFMKDQEAKLLTVCKRTMALSVARGMFTFGASEPTVSETVSIPPLDLSGKAIQTNKIISISNQVELAADFKSWPLFHNGVAAGLKVSKSRSQIDSTWIVYNRLSSNQLTEEHCGFLLALGLTGHLSVLTKMQLLDYLCDGQEFSVIALLLGISAANRGNADTDILKILSIYVTPLLPPTTLEVNSPPSAQVAAVFGIGLLFHSTCDRHLCGVLLSEIAKPASQTAESASYYESYTLALGFAVGMILLGQGKSLDTVKDLNIEKTLYRYIIGGRLESDDNQHGQIKSSSYHDQDEGSLNVNVTSPAATVALGLIFIRTNDRAIASWLHPPDSLVLLETTQPDHLLLRVVSNGLIMFDDITPTSSWIEHLLPKILQDETSFEHLGIPFDDKVTLCQSRCAIITGACLAVGLRFAGSCNKQAFESLLSYIRYFKTFAGGKKLAMLGKYMADMCLNTTLIAAAMVMAGSGNLELLRIARQSHKCCVAGTTYGSHMASHMAIGFLFLGAGRQTLMTDNFSIAALLCSIFPKFPSSCRSNRYHLQAIRHLYVLACEERIVIPVDSETKQVSYVPIDVTLKETNSYPETTVQMFAPCLLPELTLVSKISISGPRYWPSCLEISSDTSRETLLKKLNCMVVKKKSNCLPYANDPKGYKQLMARTFIEQTDKVELIKSFSNNPTVLTFAELFCNDAVCDESSTSGFFLKIMFECISEEKEEVLLDYVKIEQAVQNAEGGKINLNSMWQIKIILQFYDFTFAKLQPNFKPLIDAVYLMQVRLRLTMALERQSGCLEDEHSQLNHIASEAKGILFGNS